MMKIMKKLLCVLLVCTMLTAPFSLFGTAFAKGENTEPIKVEVLTDKESYGTFGVAEITVKVTNISDEAIENVSAEVIFEELSPVGKDSQITSETEKLATGESMKFSYEVIISPKSSELNIFQKIILSIKRLFLRKIDASDNGFNNGRMYVENVNSINFGKHKVSNIVKVWYDTISLTIDQNDFETESNPIQLSGTVKANEEIISVNYKVFSELDNNEESYNGTATLNNGKWKIDRLFVKSGNSKVVITANTNNGSTEKSIDIHYNIGEVYEPDEKNIRYDETTKTQYIDNIVVILFDTDSEERKEYIIEQIGGEVVGRASFSYQVKVHEQSLVELEKTCADLQQYEEVLFAHVDYVIDLQTNAVTPNDRWGSTIFNPEVWDEFAASGNNWGVEAVFAPSAWEYKSRFSHINVAVVDTGFDIDHKDLQGVLLPSTDWMEHVNDYKEWDKDEETEVKNSHGTHVAGTIGAIANNKKGITGLLWDTNIYYTDWSPNETKDKQSWSTTASILAALNYSVEAGAKVVNFSLGANLKIDNQTFISDFNGDMGQIDLSQSWKDKEAKIASIYMWKLLKDGYDFIVVQSAGNGVDVETSSNKWETVAVDATNNDLWCCVTENNVWGDNEKEKQEILDRIIIVGNAKHNPDGSFQQAENSNGGTRVDICAPGTDVYSTYVENKYGKMSGTSMAAPHVTGICGMVWSVNPNFTGAEVKKIVCNYTSITVNDNPDGKHTLVNTYPLVNARLAVEEAIRRTDATGIVKGIVRDKSKDTMVQGAGILIYPTSEKNSENKNTYICTTDKDGTFSVTLSVGQYTYEVSHDGYIQATGTFKIEKGVTTVLQSPIYLTEKSNDKISAYISNESETTRIVRGPNHTILLEKRTRVVDMADLLNESEEKVLLSRLDEISERQKLDVVVVTVNTLDGKTPKEYADDFYDYNGYGFGKGKDGILLLVSMENRDWWISTTGYGITVFTDDGIDYISDKFLPDLSKGNYAASFTIYACLCDDFITRARTGN